MTRSNHVWEPRLDDLSHSHVARLMDRHGIATADELRHRAAADPDWFYPAIVDDLGIEWFRRWDRLRDDSRGLPWTEWFLGGQINLVHNALDRHVLAGHGDRVALIAEDDAGSVTRLTYRELQARVRRFAGALAGLGVGAGDAVGLYLPMSAEAVVALLACLSLGAVAVPVFSGLGPEALAARLADAGVTVLLTADGTHRRGKVVMLQPAADHAAGLSGTVRTVVVQRRLGLAGPCDKDHVVSWEEIEAAASPHRPTVPLEASARALILHTPGTTGPPKGAVHTHAGVQIATAKEVGYHLDLRPGETMFWVTDIGWMMGPWQILGVLFHRGTVVLLDGTLDHPGIDRVFRIVERHRVTHLGLTPTRVRQLAARQGEWGRGHDLSSVRVLGSTGEPWDEPSYLWAFHNLGRSRCPIVNISGGTELMGCLLAPLVVAPLTPTTLQGPALGLDVDVVDDDGREVRGGTGYLVCRNAAPNMTRGFLGDPQRYLETYFSRFGESVWFHGDWARVDEAGFWYLAGRADDTLTIAGRRVGPGEVEAAAMSHPAVRQAAAVGLGDPLQGTRLVLVLVPKPGIRPSDALGEDVARQVAEQLGDATRAAAVRWVEDLPATRTGRVLRGLIRRLLAGEDAGDLAPVANLDAVEALRKNRENRGQQP